jgi:transcriptional regulator with XRE-family HTH domain
VASGSLVQRFLVEQKAAEDLLRRKVLALIAQRGWSQAEFTECLARRGYKRSQAWVSRKLTGVQPFRVRDLDMLAGVFGITVPELFFDEYGQWDRRSKTDRRKGERRQSRQTIYDPKVEPSPQIARLSFPPRHEDDGQ